MSELQVVEATTAERSSFSIPEFCVRNDISLSCFHRMQREGRGPAVMRVGRIVRISREEELRWQRALTNPTTPEAKAARERDEAAAKMLAQRAGKYAAQSSRHVSKTRRKSA